MLIDPIRQHDELHRIGIQDRARHAHRIAGAVRVVAERGRLRPSPADVLLGMRGGIGAPLRAAVRRNVLVEGRLACRRELRELEAIAAIAAVAAAAASAKAVPVRRPDAGEVVRIERQVRVEELQIPWTSASTARRRTARGRRGTPLSRHGRGQQHRHEQPYLQILHHCAFAGVFTGHPGVNTPADWVRAQRSSAAFVIRLMS